MRETRPLERRGFRRGLLRALGIGKESAIYISSEAATQPSVSLNNTGHPLVQTAWREVEQAKAKAVVELQRKRPI